MTKPSQTQISEPISSFLTLRGSRPLPPPLVSHPTDGRGNVSYVHLKVHSVHRAHGVTRVASLIFALVDLRQTAMQVALQLA